MNDLIKTKTKCRSCFTTIIKYNTDYADPFCSLGCLVDIIEKRGLLKKILEIGCE
jgi:endogenous inhibitor of DNA gyrase (YacG/DUF329 family)